MIVRSRVLMLQSKELCLEVGRTVIGLVIVAILLHGDRYHHVTQFHDEGSRFTLQDGQISPIKVGGR